ncbi:isoamylase early set domain-containing protein [Pseudaeromonas sharmana]|uniref:Isoamylase early set domain-containing protein n=1 Tax=Pseudaeromonas sharmana TaxID=328412 RepID=A0ABV8CL23_9GAMM
MPVTKKFLKSKPEVQVTFEVSKEAAQSADQVYLLGEFSDWEPVELKKMKTGVFKTTVNLSTLEQDSYQYRFRLVMDDGSEKFDNDWDAEAYVSNPFGGENSLVSVSPQ